MHMQKPRISIIAAVGENRELGKKNDLIWRIPADLGRVKKLTTGHPIIMGQNTYESIGRPLPNRTNRVLTQDENYAPEGCVITHSLDEAFEKARAVEDISNAASPHKHGEIFIFGGAFVYKSTINMADRLYLTLIHDTDNEADVFFPDYSAFTNVIEKEESTKGALAYEWLTLER